MIRGTLTVTLSENERRILCNAITEEAIRLKTDSTGRVMRDTDSLSEGRINNIRSLEELKEKIS